MKRSCDQHEIEDEHQREHLRVHTCGESTLNGNRNQPNSKSHNGKELGRTSQSAWLAGQSRDRDSRHELQSQQKLI